ncbi:hypothetical protein STENM327S_06101 [Streptomyces tendae]
MKTGNYGSSAGEVIGVSDGEGDCAEWVFPAAPDAVRIARSLVRRTLGEWRLDSVGDIAALLVSELVTNALLYATGPIGVRVVRGPAGAAGVLLVEVSDPLPAAPRARNPARRRGRPGSAVGGVRRASLGDPPRRGGQDGVVRTHPAARSRLTIPACPRATARIVGQVLARRPRDAPSPPLRSGIDVCDINHAPGRRPVQASGSCGTP